MSVPAPPPEAQAGIRRSAPVIAGGVAGASVIALLAVSSVVAPAMAGGVTLTNFLAWLRASSSPPSSRAMAYPSRSDAAAIIRASAVATSGALSSARCSVDSRAGSLI